MHPNKSLHKRYEWLDQFRGFVVLFLILSTITWELSGDWSGKNPILGPTFLNHGFCYYDGYPAIITMIDIGQQIFMFVLGFVAYLAFKSRLEKLGPGAAWKHGLIRVGVLYVLAFLDDGVLHFFMEGSFGTKDVIYNGTFANLAIGSLAAYIGVYLIKDADKRVLLSIAVMICHSIFYALPYFKHYHTQTGILFPFNAINHAAVAIMGTCFGQWYRMNVDNPSAVFKKKILPISTLCFIACYLLDWVQTAEHHDVTTSLALMAIGRAGFVMALFYGFEQIEFKVPVLSEFGKNMLLMFILTPVLQIYIGSFSKKFLAANPALALLFVGILPVIVLAGLAVILDRKKIIIKI